MTSDISWGLELWDQWENITAHTHKGLGFLETYSHFIRDRCQVETEYARSLRRLVKSYYPKKKEEGDLQFTVTNSFRDVLNETGDIAGQHELISENLTSSVLHELQNLIKDLKEERKKLLTDGSRVQQQLQHSLQHLEKAKKNYEKSFKEAEKANENYVKADADLNLSRAEVEKQRLNSSYKSHQCEDQKNEYANQLQKSNQLQTLHYTTIMPNIFQLLQDIDEKRIVSFKNFIKKSVEVEQSVFPIINKCLEGIVHAADAIDESHDSALVIEKYKSGFTPPGDIPFDDLSAPRINGEHTPVSHPPSRSETIKGTISASKLKKRVGLFGIFGSTKNNTSFSEKDDFADLAPNQRKKKLQQKIYDINAKLQQEKAARDGLQKMKEVYTGNPSLGDPTTITGQLSDANQTIDKLQSEIDRYQAMLDETEKDLQGRCGTASGGPNTPTAAAFGRHAASSPRSSVTSHRTSLSDESLSRSASDSSVCASSNNPSISQKSFTPHTTTVHTPTITLSSKTDSTTPITNRSSSFLHGSYNSQNVKPNTSVSSFVGNEPPSASNKHIPPSLGSSHSPESGIGLSHNSLHEPLDQTDGHDDEFYDAEPLPVIGTCIALYPFESTSEGSMGVAEGEKLYLVELDQGDGWTRVRKSEVFEEGFVPTTYIQITLDNNC